MGDWLQLISFVGPLCRVLEILRRDTGRASFIAHKAFLPGLFYFGYVLSPYIARATLYLSDFKLHVLRLNCADVHLR